MESGYKIIWSNEAIRNFDRTINYLESQWTGNEIKTFFTKLEKTLTLISLKPELFRLTHKRKNIRKWVLSKQTSIYFIADMEEIHIVSFFDNRQNPKKLKL